MANLQYIGARYVPKFYENPDDNSNNWKSGVSYEPLTVVTYLDDSYTSKITVPASIGNPADNSNYWIKTGNFNAAMTALQTQINNINNSLSLITDKKIIFIGDSYQGTSQWATKIAGYLGLTLNSDYWVEAIGGEGFTQGLNDNGFLARLIDANNTISDHDSITDIIVVGGVNDAKTANNFAIAAGIEDFMTYANEHFVNAKVYIGFCGAYRSGGSGVGTINSSNIEFALYQYYICTRKGAKYLSGVEYSLRHLDNQLNTDGLHPTSDAGNSIADAVINAWLNGYGSNKWINTIMTLTNAISDDTQVKSLIYSNHGDTFTITTGNTTFNIASPSGITISGSNNGTIIGTQETIFFNVRQHVHTSALVTIGNTHTIQPAIIIFEGYNIKLSLPYAPTGVWGAQTVNSVYVLPFDFTGNTLSLS